jgi:hypothetical protein
VSAPRVPDARAPFFLGVTGHRNLDPSSIPAARNQVEALFDQLAAALPNTPFVLLTALAEGADQLVAELALRKGWEILAPLPMEVERYAASFCDPQAATRMRELIASGLRTQVLGTDSEDDEACFTQLAIFLARHSHLLIALWDGEPSHGDGGTANVVHMARSSASLPRAKGLDRRRRTELRSTPPIPVAWIPVARNGRAHAELERQELGLLPPSRDNREPADPTFDQVRPWRLDEAWQDAEAWNRLILQGAIDSKQADPWQNRFQAIDQIALGFQATTRRLFLIRLALIVSSFLLLELAAGPLQGQAFASVGSLICLSIGTLGLAVPNRLANSRYLNARALAEHLRVLCQFPEARAQSKAGLNPLHHLRLIGEPADGLCRALDAWALLDRLDCRPSEAREIELLLHEWVEDQANYLARARLKEFRQDSAWRLATTALLNLGLGSSVLLALSFLPAATAMFAPHRAAIALFATAALLLAAACRTIRSYRAFAPNANRYALAEARFRNAADDTRAALQRKDPEEAQAVLRELGDLAMRENSEWLGLHLDRPPDPEI